METLRYPYQPKLWRSVLATLFFAGCTAVLASIAMGNDRGLILDGLIELDRPSATLFFWVMTLLSAGLVALGVLSVVRALGPPREVVLDAGAITGPRGLGHRTVTVPYDQITDLKVTEVKSQRILTVHHPDGRLSIARGHLPTHDDFDRLTAELADRCAAVERERV